MSFEQQDINNSYREKDEKKENEKKNRFFLEKKILAESSDLLNDLASKIAREFGIEISEAKDIISGKTSGSLDSLKNSLTADQKSQFESAILTAKSSIEDLSKKHRESLKTMLEGEKYNIENPEYVSSTLVFGKNIIEKARNPQSLKDHFIGLPVGIWESGEAILIYSYEFGKGILLSPYHFYLILTGKGICRDFKDI